jgi:hypothetical protein
MADKFADQLAEFDRLRVAIDAELQANAEEKTALEAAKLDLENKINANVLKRVEIRTRRETLSQQRQSAGVQQRVATLEDVAQQARAEAEKSRAEAAAELEAVKKTRIEVDELLAKLKASDGE